MNSVRPQPQAKYELLLENPQSPISIKHSCNRFAIAGIIISIIGVTIMTIILSWQHFTSEDTGFLLEMVQFSDSHKFPAEKFSHRSYLYGKAVKNVVKSNEPLQILKEPKALPSSFNPLKLVCYYDINKNVSHLQAEDIDPYLCTHLNIAFAHVENSTLVMNDPSDKESYKKVTNLKVANPALKVLISVGGGGEDTYGFASMVETIKSRKRFINSTISFLTKYNLDGIDFDWEFPNHEQGRLLIQLLNEFQFIKNQEELVILISVAVAAPQSIIDNSYYDIPALSKCVDYINVMSYDYHFYVWYLPETGMNAPLYPRQSDTGIMRTLNMNYTAYYWRSKGMPAEKIILGLPTYGHSFQLLNIKNNGMNAPASGFGILGTDGFISYTDACWFRTKGQANEVFDAETKSPYAYRGKEWISFDDVQSLSYKAQFIVNSGFGGAMILSLNNDDYEGEYSETKIRFPLTRQVANVLQDDQL